MKMSGFPPGFPPFFLRSLKTALISSNTQFWRGGYVRTSHWGKNRSLGQKLGFGHSVQKLDRPINRDLYRTTCIHEVLWLSWDQCTEQCFVSSTTTVSVFVFFLQDLQFEIDTERENFLSLTATGRKIIKQMDDGSSGGASQEDAALIQRRLEQMNQRWNHLKSKSIAIR